MTEEYLSRNIAGQRREQYGPSFQAEDLRQRADDIRRDFIIKYSRAPCHEIGVGDIESEPRNMWRELAKDAITYGGNTAETIGMDVGTSSGYLVDMLLEEGYVGNVLALDIHDKHFPELKEHLVKEFPEVFIDNLMTERVKLGRANAEELRGLREMSGESVSIRKNTADFTVVANVLHHTPRPKKVLSAAHRATKPGGIVIFAGRNPAHLANLYMYGNIAAREFKTTFPESFYHTYSLETLYDDLVMDPRYEIIGSNFQGTDLNEDEWRLNDGGLYIPREGWSDVLQTFYTLLPMMKKPSGKQLTRREVTPFMVDVIKQRYFLPMVEEDQYAYEQLAQGYFICRVNK